MSINEFSDFLIAYQAQIDARAAELDAFAPSDEEKADWKNDFSIVLRYGRFLLNELAGQTWRTLELVPTAPGENEISYEDLFRMIIEEKTLPVFPPDSLNRHFPQYESTFSIVTHAYTNAVEHFVRLQFDSDADMEDESLDFTSGIIDALVFLQQTGGYHANVELHPAVKRRLAQQTLSFKPKI